VSDETHLEEYFRLVNRLIDIQREQRKIRLNIIAGEELIEKLGEIYA
jgi:hypothetical protein